MNNTTTELMPEWEALEMFDQFLDECFPPYEIGELEYMPSDILKECDPIAYRVMFSEYADDLAQNGQPVEGYV